MAKAKKAMAEEQKQTRKESMDFNASIVKGIETRAGITKERLAEIFKTFFGIRLGQNYGLSAYGKDDKNKPKNTYSPIRQSIIKVTEQKETVAGQTIEIKKPIDAMQIIFDYLIGGVIDGSEEGYYEKTINEYLGDNITNVEIAVEGHPNDTIDARLGSIRNKQTLDAIIAIVDAFAQNPKLLDSVAASSDKRIDTETVMAIYTGKEEIIEMFNSLRYMKDPEKAYKAYGIEALKNELKMIKHGETDDDSTWVKFNISSSQVIKFGSQAWYNLKEALNHKSSTHNGASVYFSKTPYEVVNGLDMCILGSHKYAKSGYANQPKTDTVINIGQIKKKTENSEPTRVRYVGDIKISLKKSKYGGLESGSLVGNKGNKITSNTFKNVITNTATNVFMDVAKDERDNSSYKYIYSVIVGSYRKMKANHHEENKFMHIIDFISLYILKLGSKQSTNGIRKMVQAATKNNDQHKVIEKLHKFFQSLFGGIATSYVDPDSKHEAYSEWEANVFYKYGESFGSVSDLVKQFKVIPYNEATTSLRKKARFIFASLDELTSERMFVITTIFRTPYRMKEKETFGVDIPEGSIYYFKDAKLTGNKGNDVADFLAYGNVTTISLGAKDITDKSAIPYKECSDSVKKASNDILKSISADKCLYYKDSIFVVVKNGNNSYVFGINSKTATKVKLDKVRKT
jgi:hypothetical protein